MPRLKIKILKNLIRMEYKVEGSRPRGRPKSTWREVVEKDVNWTRRTLWIVVDGGSWERCLMIGMDVNGWTFLLVPAWPGSPRQRAVKRLCVYVCVIGVGAFWAGRTTTENNWTCWKRRPVACWLSRPVHIELWSHSPADWSASHRTLLYLRYTTHTCTTV